MRNLDLELFGRPGAVAGRALDGRGGPHRRYRRRPGIRFARGDHAREMPHRARRAAVARGRADRRYLPRAPTGRAVHRAADRAGPHLRRPGGHRDREHPPPHRDARGAGAADRDRRDPAGHQFLARRPRAGVRCDAGKGDAPVRGAQSASCGHIDGKGSSDPPRCGGFAGIRRLPGQFRAAGTRGRRATAWCAGKRLVHIPDLGGSDAYRAGDPVPRARVELGGIRTLLFVPLRKDEVLLG